MGQIKGQRENEEGADTATIGQKNDRVITLFSEAIDSLILIKDEKYQSPYDHRSCVAPVRM